MLIATDASAGSGAFTVMLARLGHAMARYRHVILMLQWLIVGVYVLLVAVPAILPLPDDDAHLWNNLTRAAQFAFWGIWWPFVMLSMMVMGRAWCGVLCPEGAVTEWASRHGLQRSIPRWIRWSGWPFLSFVCTTLFGQLTSVYQYPKAALLILGGSTLAALAIGFLYGRGVRVWCRFLCPANGVFTLLARLAPVHFGVDEKKWQAAPLSTAAVDCPPILDVHRKAGTGSCHACGRCSGHRGAVTLQPRSGAAEIMGLKIGRYERVEVFTLLFGILGVAVGAFQWSASPWFVLLKQRMALLVLDQGWDTLLQDNAPWWLLTHYPEANDVFTWLDGLAILLYINSVAVLLGGWMLLLLWSVCRFMLGDGSKTWKLAYGLTPLGGISVFLGLSMLTVTQLSFDRIHISHLATIRGALMVAAVAWSLWLTQKICSQWVLSTRQILAVQWVMLLTMLPVLTLWCLQFYVW